MKNNYFLSLTLNGKTYSSRELVAHISSRIATKNLPDWERQLYLFINELLSEKPYISAYSSGTTGAQKEIQLSKEALIASAKRTQNYLGYKKGNTALLSLPTRYIAGKMMVVRSFVSGLNLLLSEPNANPFVNVEQPIHFSAVTPYQLATSFNTLKERDNIDTIIVGGGAVPPDLIEQLQLLHAKVYETYGMTETCTHIGLKPINTQKVNGFFDVLTGITISQDQRDCLVIEMPEIAEKIITNDLVQIKGNTFKWLGRIDHVINSGGIKIIPEKVEGKLKTLIDEQFIISSVPDSKLGERLVLLLEREKPVDFHWNEFKQSLSSLLEKYEVPKDVYFITTFVRTENGKVKRNETRDLILQYEDFTN